MSTENVLISGLVPRQHREDLTAIGGGNLSEGLRAAVAAGITALAGDELPSLLRAREDVVAALRRLQAVAEARTPSGALWAAAPDALPDPASITDPTVFATPHGVLLVDHGGNLLVDAADGELVLMTSGAGSHTLPLDLAGLAMLAAELPASLVAVARDPRVKVSLTCGMKLAREVETSCVVLDVHGARIRVSVALMWQLAAEVVGLAARSLSHGAETRVQLEQTLERSPSLPVTVHE